MSQVERQELRDRLHLTAVEAEAAFWSKVKALFPEYAAHGTGQDLPQPIAMAMWQALESTVRAWAIENVPGMVEALATEKSDRLNPDQDVYRDERDQT